MTAAAFNHLLLFVARGKAGACSAGGPRQHRQPGGDTAVQRHTADQMAAVAADGVTRGSGMGRRYIMSQAGAVAAAGGTIGKEELGKVRTSDASPPRGSCNPVYSQAMRIGRGDVD